jgi:hypothetical protein
MTQEEIFFEIGKQTSPVLMGARKPLREEIIEKGQNWLNSRREEFCFFICSDAVQRIFKENQDVQDDQLRALVDVVVSLKYGIPPMVVAKAIIVLGESWFCHDETGSL